MKGKDDLIVISLDHNHMKKLGRRTKGEVKKIKAQRNSVPPKPTDENWIIMAQETVNKLHLKCKSIPWYFAVKTMNELKYVMIHESVENWKNKSKFVVIGERSIQIKLLSILYSNMTILFCSILLIDFLMFI